MTPSNRERLELLVALLGVVSVVAVAIVRVNYVNLPKGTELAGPAEQQRIKQAQLEAQRAIARKVQINEDVANLVSDHNAVTDWETILKSKYSVLGPRYSAQMSEVLVRPDGRPEHFIGVLRDVRIAGNSHECVFSSDIDALYRIDLVLTCSPSMADQIMSKRTSDGRAIDDIINRWAVVAQISSVTFSEEKLKSEDEAALRGYLEGQEVEELADVTRFRASGNCEGLLYVGLDFTKPRK